LAGQDTVSWHNEEVVEFYIAQTHGTHVTMILGVFTMLQHSVHKLNSAEKIFIKPDCEKFNKNYSHFNFNVDHKILEALLTKFLLATRRNALNIYVSKPTFI